jgi:glucose-6-phosphate 1-epimerase
MKNGIKVLMSASVALFAVVASFVAAGCKSKTWNCVSIASASGSVTVSLDGGRILSWKDANGKELFFMPAEQWSPNGDWSHGGTSICWPWFGRKGTEQSLIHGFARNRRFELRCRKAVPGGESVTLGLKVLKSDNTYFPYDADLELTVSLTDRLSLNLKTTNLGKEMFEIAEGFQTYFPVADYGKIVFCGVEAKEFALVDGMDKAFRRLTGDFGFKDAASGREFKLNASGNSGLVVWTPGTVEPANRNLAKDDCPKFIVIGPSSRPAEGAVAVKPGESHELSYTLDSCIR